MQNIQICKTLQIGIKKRDSNNDFENWELCAFYIFVGVETGSGKWGDTTTVAQIAQWKYVYNTQYTVQLHKYTFTYIHFTQLPDLC